MVETLVYLLTAALLVPGLRQLPLPNAFWQDHVTELPCAVQRLMSVRVRL